MEAKCFLIHRLVHAPATPILQEWLFSNSVKRKNKNSTTLKVTNNKRFHKDEDYDHPFFKSAISRASYRFQETLRPDPLFVDPYAGCFALPDLELDKSLEQKLLSYYCIGTRFIDDQLLNATKGDDGAKQVVLFTDGMDTRAYRLNWPPSTIIYDLSPQAVFSKASLKLQDVGAKIPRSCLLLHVPLESYDMQQVLRDKGFSGCRPSIWVFQGFPVTNLASFKEILFMVSNLAMKGCLLLGEFPVWLTKTEEEGTKLTMEKWIYKLFMSYGFRVRIIGYDDMARNHGREPVVGVRENLLFVAEHLRFSDDQMETWRMEFQRIEEEGDEEGFEEL